MAGKEVQVATEAAIDLSQLAAEKVLARNPDKTMVRVADELHVSRASFHHALRGERAFTLAQLLRVLHAAGLEIYFREFTGQGQEELADEL